MAMFQTYEYFLLKFGTSITNYIKPSNVGTHLVIIVRTDIPHYSDVIISSMASQITAYRWLTQPFVQAQIKENIKAPRRWLVCGEFIGDRWIPRTKGQ